MKSFSFLVLTAFLALSGVAHAAAGGGGGAGIYVNPTLTYDDNDLNQGSGPDIKLNTTGLGLNLGYKFTEGFTLGINYSMFTQTASSTTTTKNSFVGYGPSIGYMNEGFYGFLAYLVGPTYTQSTTFDAVLSGGSGFRFDVGYQWMINSSFGIGPGLTYTTSTFKHGKNNTGEADLTNQAKFTDLALALSLAFIF